MSTAVILLILPDPQIAQVLQRSVLQPAGFEVSFVKDRRAADALIQNRLPDLVILGDQLPDGSGLDFAGLLLERYPQLPIILLPSRYSDELALEALQLGFAGYLHLPMKINEVLQSVRSALKHRRRLEEWAQRKARQGTQSLERRIDNLETLQHVGRQVTSLLDLDRVLAAVVDAAVELTGAEEGSLLLLDENTGELYIRAGKNFQDDFVRTFRLPIEDSLAGQVIGSGQPVLINEATPQKIKTAYLVHTLMYVPIQVQDRVIGVLGVDNRQGGRPFSEYHLTLASALADYAAIAIENARLYSKAEIERSKLETILTGVEEGILVIDNEGRLVFVNPTAQADLQLNGSFPGKPAQEIVKQPDLLEILSEEQRTTPRRTEIVLDDGRVLNAQLTPIPGVGAAVTMQDITHLKDLDRIKTDFVNTVSHDLRSPLTAILGYVELLNRVGPVNAQQREFIQRIQISVHNITALINDLLDLGRIEAGFDTRKEAVSLDSVIRFAVGNLKEQVKEKDQDLILSIEPALPNVLGSSTRLHQMLNNLINNAMKYTQPGGKIRVSARSEDGQVILQVSDTGPGIPPADQPYIFDKFYRASNIPAEVPGTGLGLAIVKSIVENHQGRIWVESFVGQGSSFTVVLPIAQDLE